MSPTLHTERLILTPLQESDADLCIELFTNPVVVKHAGRRMSEEAICEEMPTWIRRGPNGCPGIWCARERDTGEKLGTGALLPMPIDGKDTDWSLVRPDRMPEADIEIGYFLKPSAWGLGYATEISLRLVQFAFEEGGLEEVVATIDDANTASRNVLLKAGFVDCGPKWTYGEMGAFFRVSRDDWRQKQQFL